MKTLTLTFILFCALTLTVSAQQQFIGAGLTSTSSNGVSRTGPYLEGLLQLGTAEFGGLTLGRNEVYAVLFPDPGARFSVQFHPAYFESWKYVKPFVGVGGQWLNLPNGDEWHSTLTLGAALPYGLQARLTRLYLAPQGWRLGADYFRPLPRNLALRASADLTVNRRARDYGVVSLGIVRTF